MEEEIQIQGVRRYVIQNGLDAQALVQLKKKVERRLCFELIWFFCVMALYVRILRDENPDSKYNFFFAEQVVTILTFLIVQQIISSKILRKTPEQNQNMLNYYTVGRGIVYTIEICLMVWVQMTAQFYYEMIKGDNWFFCLVGIGLYVQITFWGLIFILTFPCCLCKVATNRRRGQQEQEIFPFDERVEGLEHHILDQHGPAPAPRSPRLPRSQRRTMSLAIEKLSRAIDGTRFNEHLECSICLGDFVSEDHVTPLPCDARHYFHTACIKDWARRKLHCPLCQKAFTRVQLEDYNRTFSIDQPMPIIADGIPIQIAQGDAPNLLLSEEDQKVDYD